MEPNKTPTVSEDTEIAAAIQEMTALLPRLKRTVDLLKTLAGTPPKVKLSSVPPLLPKAMVERLCSQACQFMVLCVGLAITEANFNPLEQALNQGFEFSPAVSEQEWDSTLSSEAAAAFAKGPAVGGES